MITTEFKQRIVEAISGQSNNYASAKKQAVAMDVNPAQLSQIKKGKLENVIADAKWISIARKYNVTLNPQKVWKIAKTPVFSFLYQQLADCQRNSLSGLLCDIADIGKSFTAKTYVQNTKNAVYIDCSQVKTKQQLVRQIAKEYGVSYLGRYADVYADLVYYLRTIEKPMVILDEAGDLQYPAFLELKALWNATENQCAWYMIGADGLKVKINNNIGKKKVGYTEIFSRYGKRYQKVTPDGKEALEEFTKKQVAQIARANDPEVSLPKIIAKTGGSLRRIAIELTEIKKTA